MCDSIYHFQIKNKLRSFDAVVCLFNAECVVLDKDMSFYIPPYEEEPPGPNRLFYRDSDRLEMVHAVEGPEKPGGGDSEMSDRLQRIVDSLMGKDYKSIYEFLWQRRRDFESEHGRRILSGILDISDIDAVRRVLIERSVEYITKERENFDLLSRMALYVRYVMDSRGRMNERGMNNLFLGNGREVFQDLHDVEVFDEILRKTRCDSKVMNLVAPCLDIYKKMFATHDSLDSELAGCTQSRNPGNARLNATLQLLERSIRVLGDD